MNQQNPNPNPFVPQPQPKKKHTLRTVLIVLGSIFIGIPVLVGVISAATSTNAKAPVSVTSQATAKATTKAPATQPTVEATTEAPKPSLTKSQEQAIGSAEQYLSMTAFSRKGLIEQLSSDAGEGFSVADATYAVDHITVDWNEQAAKSAETYLETTHFSRSGLIEQLESSAGEGFTHAQAVYEAYANAQRAVSRLPWADARNATNDYTEGRRDMQEDAVRAIREAAEENR